MASFKDTLSRGITVLNVKSTSLIEINKIKAFISTLDRDIKELQTIIGDMVYDAWEKNEAPNMERLQPIFDQILAKKKLIKEKEAEALAIQENEKVILGNTEQARAAAEGMIVCPKCNAQYETGVNFCRKCGTKL